MHAAERIEHWLQREHDGFTAKQFAQALNLDREGASHLIKQMVEARRAHVEYWQPHPTSATNWIPVYLRGRGPNARKPQKRDFRPGVLALAEAAAEAGVTTRLVADMLPCSTALAWSYLERMVAEGALVKCGGAAARSGMGHERAYTLARYSGEGPYVGMAPPPPTVSSWGNALRGFL